MPYPPHYRLAFGGVLHTIEQWSCSLAIGSTSWNTQGATPLDSDAALNDVTADLRAWMAAAGSGISNQARLNWVKLNAIGPDGKYRDPVQSRTKILAAGEQVVGTANANPAPQVALAVTLKSARARGVASRGRVFLPTGHQPFTASPYMSSANQDAVASAFRTLIVALNNWPGIDPLGAQVCLVSPGGRGAPDGAIAPVTRVEVGRVFDTQRRRRSNLIEDFRGVDV